MNCSRTLFTCLFTAVAAADASAYAQDTNGGAEGTVAGNGLAVIERQPEVLRVQVDVFAKGKDLKESLARLKKQRAAVQKQLADLGAEAKSVRFEQVKFSTLETDEQKQMRLMVRQRMRQPGKRAAKKPEIKPPVVLAVPLSAEWSLKGDASADELMLASHELEEKIKAADLAGLKAAEELTPEEQELAEEMEGADENQMYYGGGRQQAKPGEPVFLFACRISDDERDKALAEAFADAKAEAGRLAKAAGAELGRLKHLAVNMDNSGGDEEYDPYQGMTYQYMQRMRSRQAKSNHEAIGTHAGPLKYHISVTATFALKPSE